MKSWAVISGVPRQGDFVVEEDVDDLPLVIHLEQVMPGRVAQDVLQIHPGLQVENEVSGKNER